MGKRSSFERNPRDFYRTPREAVLPLVGHIESGSWFVEPCAGDSALVHHLSDVLGLVCEGAFDIEPQAMGIERADALTLTFDTEEVEYIITNPPWDRKTLHPMIEHFSKQLPTWLLFDADWMHTRQAAPYLPYLHRVVSVGRVKWIPNSPFTGKDNCCWYLFDQRAGRIEDARFYGRIAA